MITGETTPIAVVRGHLTGDAALDTAVSRATLLRVDSGDLPETIEIGTPHDVVAFGKHDALSDGFSAAVSAASGRGFDSTVRIAGGRAVVFHPGTLRFSWTLPVQRPADAMHERFDRVARALVGALASLGVSAAVGELPGEYCPGAYSVHLRGGGKIMGAGQRLTRSAAQVGGVIVVDGADRVNDVLVPVYDLLGLPMDPSTTGAITDVAPLDVDEIAEAFVAHLAGGRPTITTEHDAETTALAATLRPDHVPLHLREPTEP